MANGLVKRARKSREPSVTDARKTGDRILDAAEELFAQNGFKVGLRDIAARAGITQPAIYTYFKDKEQLYAAVFARACQPVLSTLDLYAERAARGEPIADYVGVLLDLFVDHSNVASLMMRALLCHEDDPEREMALEWTDRMIRRGDVLDALLNPGGDRLQTNLLRVAFYGLVNGFIMMQPMFPKFLGSEVPERQFRSEYKRFLSDLMGVARPISKSGGKANVQWIPASAKSRRPKSR